MPNDCPRCKGKRKKSDHPGWCAACQREKHKENKAVGLCGCGRTPPEGRKVCEGCRASTEKVKERYKREGRCSCSRQIDDKSKARCSYCMKRSKEWNRRQRGWTEEDIQRGRRT